MKVITFFKSMKFLIIKALKFLIDQEPIVTISKPIQNKEPEPELPQILTRKK